MLPREHDGCPCFGASARPRDLPTHRRSRAELPPSLTREPHEIRGVMQLPRRHLPTEASCRAPSIPPACASHISPASAEVRCESRFASCTNRDRRCPRPWHPTQQPLQRHLRSLPAAEDRLHQRGDSSVSRKTRVMSDGAMPLRATSSAMVVNSPVSSMRCQRKARAVPLMTASSFSRGACGAPAGACIALHAPRFGT